MLPRRYNDFATAGGPETNDTALLSRFEVMFPAPFDGIARKDMTSLMSREKDPTDTDRRGFQLFQDRTRQMQKRAYWVMRAISLRCIPDVNFAALRAVLAQIASVLKIDARAQERV